MNRSVKVLLGLVILVAALGAAQSAGTTPPPPHCSVSVKDGGSPQYPELLKGSGIQGTVLIQADIGEDGCTKSVKVVRKLHPKLDELAKQTVASWKFSPARKNGEPVEVLARIPVVFKDPGK